MLLRIAIDGPGGAGKSTVAKAVAKELGIVYVDTGALYRTVGLYVARNSVDPTDEPAVSKLLPDLTLRLGYEDGTQVVYMNGERITDEIRTPQMSMYASHVSALPSVRAFLLDTQRNIAAENSGIMDRRGIGTVSLPNAEVKIFITATPEERAMRRFKELTEQGKQVSYEDVLSEMNLRDSNDSGRKIAPLKPADDAVFFDNTGYDLEQSVAHVLAVVKDKIGAESFDEIKGSI